MGRSPESAALSLRRHFGRLGLAAAVVFCSAAATGLGAGGPGGAAKPGQVRFGISPDSWRGLNRNDARAAIDLWARKVLGLRESHLEAVPFLFASNRELEAALRSGNIDAASMLTEQFLGIEAEFAPDAVYAMVKEDSITEQYVLIVHRDAGISSVAGMRGRKLALQATSRTGLAPLWLEVLLASESLPGADRFFSRVISCDSPSKAVLQVFFDQAAAGIVTARALELSGELNPQIRHDLRVVATSALVVPAVFFFRSGFDRTIRDQIEKAMLGLHKDMAGRQVLTVFQGDAIRKLTPRDLQATRDLIRDYARVHARLSGAALSAPSASLPAEPAAPAGESLAAVPGKAGIARSPIVRDGERGAFVP